MTTNAPLRRPQGAGCIQLVMAGLLTGGGLLALVVLLWPLLLPGTRPAQSQATPRAESLEQGSLGGHGRLRQFAEHGRVSALFVQMGAYRGGESTFAVVGLSSRRLHDVGSPWFRCAWEEPGERQVRGAVEVLKPDWGMGQIYTVLVLNCSFPGPVGTLARGGSLVVEAGYGKSDSFSPPEIFTALEEASGEYNSRLYSWEEPPAHDFLFCGSPLFGSPNPQRIREWVAYHARLFGTRSLFVFHDAGGIDGAVREVLQPWEQVGLLVVENVRNQARYDGYYYNQFLVLNDCLHRARFLARWVFFFDIDEFLVLEPGATLLEVMNGFRNFTQVLIPQRRMSDKLCAYGTDSDDQEHWAEERLVYKAVVARELETKYAVQPGNVYATGVHRTEQFQGQSTIAEADRLRYYHFHGSIGYKGQVCREVPRRDLTHSSLFRSSEGGVFELDDGLARSIPSVREFELAATGRQPFVPGIVS